MTLLAIILGVLAGILFSLIPGLNLPVVLSPLVLYLAPTWGMFPTACFVASAAGSALYAQKLSFIFNPSAAGASVASLEPAVRLARDGKGFVALQLLWLGTDLAWWVVGAFALVALGCKWLNVPLIDGINGLVRFVAPVVIVLWIGYTCKRSGQVLTCLMGFAFAGWIGYVDFHAPNLMGSEQQLTPLMSGLWGVPMALMGLKVTTRQTLTITKEEIHAQTFLGLFGAGIGFVTGFFPGLGSGSLVSLAEKLTETDEDYVLLSAAGESTNALLALVLILAAGLGRSGEAVILGRVAQNPDAWSLLAILGCLGIGAWIGRESSNAILVWYQRLIALLPGWAWSVIVIVFSVLPLWLVGETSAARWTGLALFLASLTLAFWLRSQKLPNQVAFAALALPIWIQMVGLVPWVNKLVF